MHQHNILLTGASGYLGGDLLPLLTHKNLPNYDKLYALVRTDAQADTVEQYGAKPIKIDIQDERAVYDAVVTNNISIVFFLIDSATWQAQVYFIKALAEVKKINGGEVHFLHTTGAKIFSSHAGAPTDRPLLDTDPNLYEIQKAQQPATKRFQEAVNTNNIIIETAITHGVRSCIFAPCIVYGKSRTFGNPISSQTVAIVRAALALRCVYAVDPGNPTWPVCHVSDVSGLYLAILKAILNDDLNLGYGKNGYYLASSGSVAWLDIYTAMAKALKAHDTIDDETISNACGNEEVLGKMAKALGVDKPGMGTEWVGVMLGGKCTFTAKRGKEALGWEAKYKPEHILEAAGEEVDLILEHLKKEQKF